MSEPSPIHTVSSLFDTYGRQARLYPALLTSLPAIALALSLYPTLAASDISSLILGLAVTCGAVYFLSDIGRTFGKQLEPSLIRDWGGWPTTEWLRHSSSHLTTDTRARYHAFLSARLPALQFPTSMEEVAMPGCGDSAYTSAVDWLKEQCRGKRFQLVHKENAAYGFRRNLLGLRPFGVAISAIVVVCAVALLLASQPTTPQKDWLVGTVAVSVIALLIWLFIVRKSWVRQAGNSYARALLSCCDSAGGL